MWSWHARLVLGLPDAFRLLFQAFDAQNDGKTRDKWLLRCHVCCIFTTVGEHLASTPGDPCQRRFSATPLYEMMARAAARMAGPEPF